MRRFTSTVAMVACVLLVPALDGAAYYDKAHEATARAAVDLIRRTDDNATYAEIHDEATGFAEALYRGSTDEDYGAVDGNERSFRHYYDPTVERGVDWFAYFRLWPTLIPGCQVEKPDAGHFPSALRWAQNGADTLDVRNWKGAVETYGYTASSRREAYWRLGHVVHLLTDMAEPDHATNTPHAASGYRLPRDAQMIIGMLPWKSLRADYQQQFETLVALYETTGQSVIGYELFAEEYLPEIRGSRVVRHPTLKGAFDQMAHLSRRAIERLDITLPVGVCFWPGDPQHWPGEDVFASGDLRFSSKKDYSFIPNINPSDDARRKRYDQLMTELLTHATDRAAGILQLYFDAVNPPPYVKRVTVTQGGTTRYEARWVDRERVVQGVHDGGVLKYSHPYRHLVVDGRRLVRTRTAPIQSGEPAGIEIEFGPAPPVPGAAGVRMDAESVLVSVHERYVNGALSEDGRTWRGTVTHTLAGGRTSQTVPIHITARDRGPHLEGENGGGMYLDGDPGTPARASCPVPGSAPTFLGNESGYDEHHAVTIRDMIDPEIPHVRVGVGIKLRVTENHSKEGTRETLEEVSLEARGHFTKGRFTGIIDTRKGRNRTTGTLTATVEPTTGEVLTLEVDATMVEAVLAKAGMLVDRSGSTRTVSAKIKNVPYLLCWDRRGPVPPGRHEIFRPGWHSCRIRGKAAEASVVSFASSWQHVPAPGSNQDEPPPSGSVTGWRCEEKSEIVVSLGTH